MKTSRAIGIMWAVLLLLAGTGCAAQRQVTAGVSSPQPDKQGFALEQLYKLTEQFYNAAIDQNRQLAFMIAGRLERTASADGVRLRGNLEGWKALDQSMGEAQRALSREGTVSDWALQAARLKLAADSLIRPKAPVWLQYSEVLQDDLDRLQQAWRSSSAQRVKAAQAVLKEYQQHAERIEVAALLQRPEPDVRFFQSQIRYTVQVLAAAASDQRAAAALDPALAALNAAAGRLFEQPPEEAAAAKLASTAPMDRAAAVNEQLTAMFVSAFVMGILGLAGWRRYAYERRHGTPVPPRGGGSRTGR